MIEKLSSNFKRSEFACKCGCGYSTVDVELIAVLEAVRSSFSEKYPVCSVEITSACRCEIHNAECGGKPSSKHLDGIAADIKVWHRNASGVLRQIPPTEVYNHLDSKYGYTYGLGLYKTFTHIDIRTVKARWSA